MTDETSLQLGNMTTAEEEEFALQLEAQKGVLPIFVHPLYNLMTAPYWTHDIDYTVIRTDFATLLSQRKRDEVVDFLNSVPNHIHKESVVGTSNGINETHSQYYRRLSAFLANTTLRVLATVESVKNIPDTEFVFRACGFHGLLLIIASLPGDPEPVGISYRDEAEFFMNQYAQKLVVGGQNNWVRCAQNNEINQTPPYIRPAEESNFSVLSGCVGHYIRDLSSELNRYTPTPLIQLSSLTWPQRRGFDPSNTEWYRW